jgi:hypothetical protein
MMAILEESTVVGAMFLSPTRMDIQVPDVLMSVMTHGTVVTNMIPLHAAQAGPVTRRLDNASWLTQETVLVASLGALSTADHTQDLTHTDATLPAIPATPVNQVTLDAAQIEQLNAEAAQTQIQALSTDATEPIQIIHSASHVTIRIRLTVTQEPRHATVALHHHSSSNVTPRHLLARQPTTPEMSKRPVTQVVDTSPQ